MLLLKLRPAPTGPAVAPGPGTGTVRLTRSAPRGRVFKTLALQFGQYDPTAVAPEPEPEDENMLEINGFLLEINGHPLEIA